MVGSAAASAVARHRTPPAARIVELFTERRRHTLREASIALLEARPRLRELLARVCLRGGFPLDEPPGRELEGRIRPLVRTGSLDLGNRQHGVLQAAQQVLQI